MSHNPQPFFRINSSNRDKEILNFVNNLARQTDANKELDRPAIMFVKYELPSEKEAEEFLQLLMKCIQLGTKHIFKDTLHVSQLTTTDTKINQLDLILGVGLKADAFEKILRQIILSINSKDGLLGVPPQTEESAETSSTAADKGGNTSEDTESL